MGKLFVVGLGPGGEEHLTPRAREALEGSSVVVGYETYIKLIEELTRGKRVVSTGMKREVERVEKAISLAREGENVALVSSGDAGVYGMASLVFELLAREGKPLERTPQVEVVPGITSALATSALLGAPLGHDFAVISLSDLLTPWEVIEERLESAGRGDFAVVLYNPGSRKRRGHIKKARDILLRHREPETPAGIVSKAFREGEQVELTTLQKMAEGEVGMLSTVIVGNSQSFTYRGWMITPRGYVV